mmetsp:Transcript_17223/g.20503  ORF Transcript_17223/g.20503 Transcript_17223/m.20503 type:complete len:119 (+) Transcript_17223:70-426(+)
MWSCNYVLYPYSYNITKGCYRTDPKPQFHPKIYNRSIIYLVISTNINITSKSTLLLSLSSSFSYSSSSYFSSASSSLSSPPSTLLSADFSADSISFSATFLLHSSLFGGTKSGSKAVL